jgi:uncharacterized membrane protein YfcA
MLTFYFFPTSRSEPLLDIALLSLLAAGLVTGFSKFSIGGMGLIILPIVMLAVPGPAALGIVVPIYVMTDVMAIVMYRKNIQWSVLARLLPLSFLGVALGGWWLSGIDTEQFTSMLGAVIVAILLLGIWLDYKPTHMMKHPLIISTAGLLAGFVSLIANAAGPLLSLILIEQKLSKEAYVSTRAWGFLMINLAKLPVLSLLGFVNGHATLLSLQCLPGLIVGSVIGYYVLSKLNIAQFKWLIRIMALIAAIKILMFS